MSVKPMKCQLILSYRRLNIINAGQVQIRLNAENKCFKI